MIDVASDILEELEQSSGMLPRRWYTDEIAPPLEHQVRLSSQTWRYRIITRRQHEDTTPTVGVVSSSVGAPSLRFQVPRPAKPGVAPEKENSGAASRPRTPIFKG